MLLTIANSAAVVVAAVATAPSTAAATAAAAAKAAAKAAATAENAVSSCVSSLSTRMQRAQKLQQGQPAQAMSSRAIWQHHSEAQPQLVHVASAVQQNTQDIRHQAASHSTVHCVQGQYDSSWRNSTVQ